MAVSATCQLLQQHLLLAETPKPAVLDLSLCPMAGTKHLLQLVQEHGTWCRKHLPHAHVQLALQRRPEWGCPVC